MKKILLALCSLIISPFVFAEYTLDYIQVGISDYEVEGKGDNADDLDGQSTQIGFLKTLGTNTVVGISYSKGSLEGDFTDIDTLAYQVFLGPYFQLSPELLGIFTVGYAKVENDIEFEGKVSDSSPSLSATFIYSRTNVLDIVAGTSYTQSGDFAERNSNTSYSAGASYDVSKEVSIEGVLTGDGDAKGMTVSGRYKLD